MPTAQESAFTDPLRAGHEALARGAWDKARAAYATALAREETPEALAGSARALQAQGRSVEAAEAEQEFHAAWRRADVPRS